jgi:hypothetical protein
LTKLAHLLCIILEVHCMAGLRDPYFASTKPVPLKVTVADIDDSYDGKCNALLCWQEKGHPCSMWTVLCDEDGYRVKRNQSYSLVRSRSIRHADPFVLTCQQVRAD